MTKSWIRLIRILPLSVRRKEGVEVINERRPHLCSSEGETLPNDSIMYFEKLKSNSRFEIENILEGKYKILVISDTDNNNDFTGGSFFPLKASEWFYEYPDTFQIRANWEIDVGQIEKE